MIDDLVSLTGPTPSVLGSVITPVQALQSGVGSPFSGIGEAQASPQSGAFPVGGQPASSGKKTGLIVGGIASFIVIAFLGWQFMGGGSQGQVVTETVKVKVQEHLMTASSFKPIS